MTKPVAIIRSILSAAVIVAAAVIGSADAAAPLYKITMLDVLPGGQDSLAFGLNDVGQLVGDSRLDRSGHIGQARPVVWDYAGVPTELWSDPVIGGSATDINKHGVIVGRYGSGSGIPLPGPGVPYGRGFVWDAIGGRRDLGLEPVGNSQAVAVNDAGQVVGTSEVLMDIGGSSFFVPRAFIWDETNGIQDIGTLGGSFSFANDVNAHGQVVGYSEDETGFERPFIWDDLNGMRELPGIIGGSARATAINDFGVVVGGEFGFGGFLWDMTNGIRTIPIGGNDINNQGQVVGGSIGDVAIWDQINGVQLLVDLIPEYSNWQFESALAINDAGEIVGIGKFNGEIRGFLLTPVPEPRAAILVAVAFLAMLIIRLIP